MSQDANMPREERQREIVAILRTLRSLREEEIQLLRKLEAAMSIRAAGDDLPSPAQAARPPVQAADSDSWIDQAVEAAFSRAFDGLADPQFPDLPPPAAQEPRTGVADLLAPAVPPMDDLFRDATLLLARCGDDWVGIPASSIQEIELIEPGEADPTAATRSLAALLRGGRTASGDPERIPDRGGAGPPEIPAGGGSAEEEVYRVTCSAARGAVSLVCASLERFVSLSAAAERGVEAVLVPFWLGSAGSFSLLPMLDYLALPEMEDPPETARPVDALRSSAVQSRRPDGAFPARPAVTVSARIADRLDRTSQREGSTRVGFPSALLAVRYLPARVALGRTLRSAGWHVVEEVDAYEVPVRLSRTRFTAAFAEMPPNPPADLVQALRQAESQGTVLLGVGSRLRVAADDPLHTLGDVPRLLYPFQEGEVSRVLSLLAPATRSL